MLVTASLLVFLFIMARMATRLALLRAALVRSAAFLLILELPAVVCIPKSMPVFEQFILSPRVAKIFMADLAEWVSGRMVVFVDTAVNTVLFAEELLLFFVQVVEL